MFGAPDGAWSRLDGVPHNFHRGRRLDEPYYRLPAIHLVDQYRVRRSSASGP
jgi:hypothetical protein